MVSFIYLLIVLQNVMKWGKTVQASSEMPRLHHYMSWLQMMSLNLWMLTFFVNHEMNQSLVICWSIDMVSNNNNLMGFFSLIVDVANDTAQRLSFTWIHVKWIDKGLWSHPLWMLWVFLVGCVQTADVASTHIWPLITWSMFYTMVTWWHLSQLHSWMKMLKMKCHWN